MPCIISDFGGGRGGGYGGGDGGRGGGGGGRGRGGTSPINFPQSIRNYQKDPSFHFYSQDSAN